MIMMPATIIFLTDKKDIELFANLGAAMDDSVSEFIVGTCRMLPKSSSNVSESMQFRNLIQMEKYFIVSGSCAEFFIQPLHSSIGDVDFLQMKPHSLAFTGEEPVLPYDLRHNSQPTDCMLMEP